MFRIFLRLGLTSFGGPVAHIGYFRRAFVVRRQWLDEAAYADLVALCQFLPGPASSQVGFSIGLMRAGYLGGLAAWTGFTLPSAVAMVAFAYGAGTLRGPIGMGLLHGLKLVAVAVVAQAVVGMARTLCPDVARAAIAIVAATIVLWWNESGAQLVAIGVGAVAGLWMCRAIPGVARGQLAVPISRRVGALWLGCFLGLLLGLAVLRHAGAQPAVAMFAAFYRCGALVFGGGHVVLPLLRTAFVGPGLVGNDAFLAGYGVAQALPGPLFSVAAYLGAIAHSGTGGIAGAMVGLAGIFLPGILLVAGALPFWDRFRQFVAAQAVMRGVNAAVVGLLAAALYNPVWVSSVQSIYDVVVVVAAFLLLMVWQMPPLVAVVFCAACGMIGSIS